MTVDIFKKEMIKQHYKIVGSHSAVKLCSWLRKSIRDKGFCYKQKFYGIESHRCLQMTPWIGCCNQCRYCWRIIEKTPLNFEKIDEPKEIIKGCIEAQRELINGFPGHEGMNAKKWKEANNPNNVAISLVGEPTLYPKISDLIKEFNNLKFTTFLVTNGQMPERLKNINEPTQLYISLDAPTKEIYKEIDRPSFNDFWERLNKSLELMNSFSCRKVLRLTAVKFFNMTNIKEYTELINKANPDFIEVKGYAHVGESKNRLNKEHMPNHNEIKEFVIKLSDESGYIIKDYFPESYVVLLSK